ncbi:MAG: diguanylate cyclase [Methylococcaceae bacterium]|nr:diguanylate cyclase [Methylococcaceae bacterium]
MNLYFQRYLPSILPWLVLMTGLLVTGLTCYEVKLDIERNEYQQFVFYCYEISTKITARLNAHKQIVLSSAALFDASQDVTRQQWHDFVQRLRSDEHFKGIQGLGFLLWIPAEQLAAHQAQQRAEVLPDYKIYPEGQRNVYTPIVFLEPINERNLRAFGYDMYSEPVRRAAMEQARDQNKVTLSGKVTLIQETDQNVQAGTLMYAPVYRKNQHNAVRRAAIYGWVFSPFRMDDFLEPLVVGFNNKVSNTVHLRIYDGHLMQADTLLYDSAAPSDANRINLFFIRKIETTFGGALWTLQFNWIADGIDYSKVWIILSAGSLSSFLLSLLFRDYFIMRQFARTDPLTGLFNRRVFLEQLEQEKQKVARLPRYSAVLLMLDLDFFKKVNDTYGHATGDAVLKAFAKIAHNNSRTIDMPARLGGEEFAILLSGADQNDAQLMAERLRWQVAELIIDHQTGPVQITVSIGAACILGDDISGYAVLQRADAALYKAKDGGRNQICWA